MHDRYAAKPKTNCRLELSANDCYKYIMDVCTNAGIVGEALKFVQQKT